MFFAVVAQRESVAALIVAPGGIVTLLQRAASQGPFERSDALPVRTTVPVDPCVPSSVDWETWALNVVMPSPALFRGRGSQYLARLTAAVRNTNFPACPYPPGS